MYRMPAVKLSKEAWASLRDVASYMGVSVPGAVEALIGEWMSTRRRTMTYGRDIDQSTPVDRLDMGVRAAHAVEAIGAHIAGDLLDPDVMIRLQKLRGCGPTTRREIQALAARVMR